MATASLALNGTVEKMHAVLAEIDEKFAVWREKMSQLLALASMRKPIPFPPTEPRQDWLKKVWRQLGESAEARGMHVYLNATMAVSDRLQLLDELIMNLVPDAPPVTLEC
ncbi:MAG: hypothetical protein ACE5FU_14450 [Nitrospinota bacterium]